MLFRKTHIDGKIIYGIVKDQGGNQKLGYLCHLGSGEGRTLEGKRMGKMYIDTSIISQVEVSSCVSHYYAFLRCSSHRLYTRLTIKNLLNKMLKSVCILPFIICQKQGMDVLKL